VVRWGNRPALSGWRDCRRCAGGRVIAACAVGREHAVGTGEQAIHSENNGLSGADFPGCIVVARKNKDGKMAETINIGSITLRFLRSKHDTGGSLDMFEMDVQPDGRMPVPHYHRDWDEVVYGLAGTLVFTVDGHATAIGPGDSAFVPRGIVHGFANSSGAPATVLSVLTPGVLGPEYFREFAAHVVGGTPDPAVMREIMLRHGLVPVPG